MRNKKIDFSIWVSQQKLATELNVSVQTINNWIKRGKIESIVFEPLNKVLVNKKTIRVKKHCNKFV